MTFNLQGPGSVLAWLQRGAGQLARLGLLALVAVGVAVPAAAGAAVLAEPDARTVRQVVEAQLEAFAADDAERAFSYASASIRIQFGNASSFMAMVRGGYPMVVRPASISFLQAQAVDGVDATVSQPVHLRDEQGRLWMATYVLERQAGEGWRITGCVVAADSAKMVT